MNNLLKGVFNSVFDIIEGTIMIIISGVVLFLLKRTK